MPVQKDLGVALFVVQLGGTPPSAKPWKGQGAGIYELVEDHRGDTYRAVYTVRIAGCVHVPARIPEEVKDRDQDAAPRYRAHRTQVEDCFGPASK